MLKTPPYLLITYLFVPLLATNYFIKGEQQFVILAHSFLNGHLDIEFLKYPAIDLSFYLGKYYWPNGPFPAILITPFVFIFGTSFLQWIVQFPLSVLNFWLVHKIAKKLDLPNNKSLLLSTFFVFGSVYTPVAAIPFAWHFAQIIATSLLLLATCEFLTKRRYFLIGILIGLAILTRATLVGSSIFFLFYLFKKPVNLKKLLQFLVPILIALILSALYNFTRFGNILESGYTYQLVPEELKQVRNRGLFSIAHVPSNFYYMVIKPPNLVFYNQNFTFPFIKYDNWGLSIFLLSPILLLMYRAKLNNLMIRASAATIFLTLSPILAYYGNGYQQIGFRYALDFFPFLLIILASVIKTVEVKKLKILVILGIIITWFFIFEKLSGF